MSSSHFAASVERLSVLGDVPMLEKWYFFSHPLSSYKFHHGVLQMPGVLKPCTCCWTTLQSRQDRRKSKGLASPRSSPDRRVGIDLVGQRTSAFQLPCTFSLTAGSQWAQGGVLQVLYLSSWNTCLVLRWRTLVCFKLRKNPPRIFL